MSKPFVFEQFEIHQSRAAFKLGTDSVILGCWLPAGPYFNILDIGSGTGILSLIMAQRFADSRITAIEIDEGSFMDSANNFTQSKWSNRLVCINEDMNEWSDQNKDSRFNLIISNPPYFQNSLLNPDARLSGARHNQLLGLAQLAHLVKAHLEPHGKFGCVLPVNEFRSLQTELEKKDIYLHHGCYISSFGNTEVIRITGLFGQGKAVPVTENRFLYNPDKSRSAWYRDITAGFYIR